MATHVDKIPELKPQSNGAEQVQKQGESDFDLPSLDKRPEAISQKKLQAIANDNPRVAQLAALQNLANHAQAGNQPSSLPALTSQVLPQELTAQEPLEEEKGTITAPDHSDETPRNLKNNHNTVGAELYQLRLFAGSRPESNSTIRRRQVTDLATARMPGREEEILAIYEQWVADDIVEGRRFPNLAAIVTAIIDTLPAARRTRIEPGRVVPAARPTPTPVADQDAPTLTTRPPARLEPLQRPPARLEPLSTPIPSAADPQDQRLQHARLAAPPLASPPLPQESSTRVGFEVEVGGHYFFPAQHEAILDQLVNQTLFVCTLGTERILEMLLDDIRLERGQAVAQVEFRTPPLNFERIDSDLTKLIRLAINGFSADMLGNPIEHSVPVSRTETPLVWTPTTLCTRHAAILGTGRSTGRFRAPTSDRLAQHATTSIELEAFTTLSDDQQNLLFPQGAGARTKQALLNRMAARARGAIDASASGRNAEGSPAKTPIESILAADPSLQPPRELAPNQVTLSESESEQFNTLPLPIAVALIRNATAFPHIQGQRLQGPDQARTGFRAVAEKLQPPLEDTQSGELRVLIEHRVGGLVDQVNAALMGNPSALNRIRGAAARMDRNRLNRASINQPGSSQPLPGGPPSAAAAAAHADAPGVTSSAAAAHADAPGASSSAAAAGPQLPDIRPPDRPLDLQGFIVHYMPCIPWASAQGTFSPEFLAFMHHPEPSFAALTAAGLAPGEAAALQHRLAGIFAAHPGLPDYPDADTQGRIFDQLPHNATLLWAILRYLNARG